MGEWLLNAVLLGWAGWSLFNAVLLVMAGSYGGSDPLLAMHVRGVFKPTIHVREGLEQQVSYAEYTALLLHERGHIRLGHLRHNALMAVLLPWWPRTQAAAEQQELAADHYVVVCGYGRALASALRKISLHPFDLRRAELVDVACETQVGLASGTDAPHVKGEQR